MPAVFDFKKVDKEFYTARIEPEEIRVPPMKFIMDRGRGVAGGEAFNTGVKGVIALSNIIKAGKGRIRGYYDYRLPPPESYFWIDPSPGDPEIPPNTGLWCCMLRQPDFVEDADFEWAKEEYRLKNPNMNIFRINFCSYTEGRCVQMLHTGPRNQVSSGLKKVKAYMDARQLSYPLRRRHEIYLNDSTVTAPEKLKTILRLSIETICSCTLTGWAYYRQVQ
jgi:hypothetical protein